MNGPAPGRVTLDNLSDDALRLILSAFPPSERAGLARVCRRWRRLVTSTSLHVGVGGACAAAAARKKAASFSAWLRGPGGKSLRELSLRITPPEDAGDPDSLAFQAYVEAFSLLVSGVVALCASPAAQLASLEVEVSAEHSTAPPWLEQLTTLSHLSFTIQGAAADPDDDDDDQGSVLSFVAQLASLTALRELRLAGRGQGRINTLTWGATARLPAGLTLLHLEGARDGQLGLWLRGLPNLRSLSLASMPLLQGACLSQQTALQHLRLSDGTAVPGSLPQLGGLQELEADLATRFPGPANRVDAQNAASFGQWLATHTQLTALSLNAVHLPDCVPHLGRLQRLVWWSHLPPGALFGSSHADPLPDGAYLASLRQLWLRERTLAASLAVLSAAPQLREVGVAMHPALVSLSEQDLVRWACQQPQVRRLRLCADHGMQPTWEDEPAGAQAAGGGGLVVEHFHPGTQRALQAVADAEAAALAGMAD